MKKHWIEYSIQRPLSPLTFWVHIESDGQPRHKAQVFAPPLPNAVPGKGFAKFFIEFDSAILYFASLAELRVCIETLSLKNLPTSLILSAKRGTHLLNQHWLSRFPLRPMTWAYRQKVVKYMKVALADFTKQTKNATE